MNRLIVGISGASGVQYGLMALKILQSFDMETHLIISKSAEKVIEYELNSSKEELIIPADVIHPVEDIGASVASGSFKSLGMLIAPCTIRTMSEIATGTTSSLLTRAADVVLKERRKLVLMVRETPLHLGHLRSMVSITEMGGIIMPPVPSFYTQPKSVDDIIFHTVCRALDLFGLECEMPRWDGKRKG